MDEETWRVEDKRCGAGRIVGKTGGIDDVDVKPELVHQARQLAIRFGAQPTFAVGSFIPDDFHANVRQGDEFYRTETNDLDAYGEFKMDLGDFDLIYAYPWPEEHAVFRSIVRRCAAPHALYLRYDAREGLSLTRSRYGPEPISADFDLEKFATSLRKKKKVVKAALLDQNFVAGLGNIYVDEALFFAGVRPTRRADKLTKKEALLIGEGAKKVLEEALGHGGTTFQHFLDAEGKVGNHSEYLQVFGRQGKPCLRCGGLIKKTRVAGRGTHYCPKCQR